ncbi:Calx-beta domain protein [Bremerella volcania]|uniref:Calx-beta domain protein n=1 Tax=Bremerella volcania TaxID=2527984 RepID=A0A518C8V6_9BACT|nr:Calx-beta domain-containing protein [Bremerella volcania]QDU75665.1 Calx-beta domain protein [Bremerella volcania]
MIKRVKSSGRSNKRTDRKRWRGLRLELCELRLLLTGEMQFVWADDAIAAPSTALDIPVQYQTLDVDGDPLNALASGLGLRMHFDSTKLTFDGLGGTFTEDIFFNPDTVTLQDDVSDLDNDPTTDKYLTAVWNDLIQVDGGWPSSGSQPLTLYTANFTTALGFSGQTSVNFTSSSPGTNPSSGLPYEFKAQSSLVSVPPMLSVVATDANKNEGDSGTTDFTFNVIRSGVTSESSTVDYTITGSGTNAADASDFGGSLPNGQITFAAGETSKTITVPVSGDTQFELDEEFTVTLENPARATIQTETVTGTILNDDTAIPTITAIDDQVIDEDGTTGALAFTLGDLDTDLDSLVITASSDNLSLVPDENIVFGGSGANRTVEVSPAADASGSAEITVSVFDGTNTTTENLTVMVNPINDKPTITAIGDVTIRLDGATPQLPFAVGDIDDDVNTLVVSAVSDNQALLPDSQIVVSDTGANRTIQATPVSGQEGVANITVTVADSSSNTTEQFAITVSSDGVELFFEFDVPGMGKFSQLDEVVLAADREYFVTVYADKLPAIDLISYQLNFAQSDLGAGLLALSDWSTAFSLPVDSSLSTPSDTLVAAANLQSKITPVALGTFKLSTPSAAGIGPEGILLSLDKLTGQETSDTTIGNLNGQSLLIVDYGDVVIHLDGTAPTVTNIEANVDLVDPVDLPTGAQPAGWTAQRSDVRNIVVTFDEPIAEVVAADLVLTNLGIDADVYADQVITLTDGQLSVDGNTLTIIFAPYELSDGIYQLDVLPTVTDVLGNSLDGDKDTHGGDAFVEVGSVVNKLFKLTGDYNGSGGVNILDSATPIYWFGSDQAPQYVDLNQSGAINILDFSGYVANFGVELTFPPEVLAAQSGRTLALSSEPFETVESSTELEVATASTTADQTTQYAASSTGRLLDGEPVSGPIMQPPIALVVLSNNRKRVSVGAEIEEDSELDLASSSDEELPPPLPDQQVIDAVMSQVCEPEFDVLVEQEELESFLEVVDADGYFAW